MKYTTESSAWAAIARQLQRENKMPQYVSWGGDEAQPGNRCAGLCTTLMRMERLGEISGSLRNQMQSRVHQHITVMNTRLDGDPRWNGSAYLAGPGKVAPRIIAAQLLALEAKEDERETEDWARAVSRGLREADGYEPSSNAYPDEEEIEPGIVIRTSWEHPLSPEPLFHD